MEEKQDRSRIDMSQRDIDYEPVGLEKRKEQEPNVEQK